MCYLCNIHLAMKPLDRKYEKFLAGPNKHPQEVLYVSINKGGRIRLNRNCHRQLGRPPAAYLYYSRPDDTIVVEAAHSDRMQAAFPFTEMDGSGGWRINAASFCRHHNIRPDKTERFIAPEIEDGRLFLKLSQTVT